MKRSGFKRPKVWSRKPSQASHVTRRRTKLRVVGISDKIELKKEIQALLRAISLIRDGGCVFRNYLAEMGHCGGYSKKTGDLILQFDHLNSRVHAISFSDVRLGIIACQRHHIFFKRQYPDVYERCVIKAIGPERAKLLFLVREDRRAHKIDLKLEKIALEQELRSLSTAK